MDPNHSVNYSAGTLNTCQVNTGKRNTQLSEWRLHLAAIVCIEWRGFGIAWPHLVATSLWTDTPFWRDPFLSTADPWWQSGWLPFKLNDSTMLNQIENANSLRSPFTNSVKLNSPNVHNSTLSRLVINANATMPSVNAGHSSAVDWLMKCMIRTCEVCALHSGELVYWTGISTIRECGTHRASCTLVWGARLKSTKTDRATLSDRFLQALKLPSQFGIARQTLAAERTWKVRKCISKTNYKFLL